jgi:hypothetical protein
MNKSKKRVWGSYYDENPATPPVEPPAPTPEPVKPAPVVPAPVPVVPAVPTADDTATAMKAALDKALADKATLEKQLAEAKKEKPVVPNPAEKPVVPPVEVDVLAKMQADFDAKLKASELKAFKLQAIRDAGEEVFPELVDGDSEEAILASVTKSKERYQQVLEKGKALAPAPAAAAPAVPQEPGSPAPAVPTAIRPEAGNSQELSFESIQAMSNDDYAKNRDRIKSEMSGFKYQGM